MEYITEILRNGVWNSNMRICKSGDLHAQMNGTTQIKIQIKMVSIGQPKQRDNIGGERGYSY
jgi:hypothetical protein